ncbi:type II toxin-antitoxin system RelE family toxin [Brachyspira hyodysenteriae]
MKVSITRTAKKSLEKLDRNIQKRILDFLSYL